MKVLNTTCPHCGASLPVNDKSKLVKCEYCGASLLIYNELVQAEESGYYFEKGRQRARKEMSKVTEERPYHRGRAYSENRYSPSGDPVSEEYSQTAQQYQPTNSSKQAATQKKTRTGMMVLAIVFFVISAMYALIGNDMPEGRTLILPFIILGIMFLTLSKTPKKSKYLFGKSSGVKTVAFVPICACSAFYLVVITNYIIGL